MNFWSAFQQESEYFTLIVLSLLPSVVAVVIDCVLRFLLGVLALFLPSYRDQMAISSRGLPFKHMYRPHWCHAWL